MHFTSQASVSTSVKWAPFSQDRCEDQKTECLGESILQTINCRAPVQASFYSNSFRPSPGHEPKGVHTSQAQAAFTRSSGVQFLFGVCLCLISKTGKLPHLVKRVGPGPQSCQGNPEVCGPRLPPVVIGQKPVPQEGGRAPRLCCRDRVSLGVRYPGVMLASLGDLKPVSHLLSKLQL